MPSIEFDAALMQLEALGFLEIAEDGKKMHLTGKGIDRAQEVLGRLPMDERVLVAMGCADFLANQQVEVDENDNEGE